MLNRDQIAIVVGDAVVDGGRVAAGVVVHVAF